VNARRGAALLFVAALFGGLGQTAARAAAPPPTILNTTGVDRTGDFRIGSLQTWTNTKFVMHAGETAHVSASGFVHFGVGRIARVPADGLTWGPQCFTLGATTRASFPAPGLPCYGLIGRVGNGKAQRVGATGAIRADADGPLFLGVNDNYLRDNVGSWAVAVSVAAPAAQPGAPAAKANASSLPIGLIAIGAGALALLIAAFVLNGKRRPAFALDPDLVIGHVRVRVSSAGDLERVTAEGDVLSFEVEREDFGEHVPDRSPGRFAWHGLSFSAVAPRMPLGKSRGVVQRVGQHVAGSGGITRGPDGFLRGEVPLRLRRAWVFTLDSAATRVDAQGYVEGDLVMIVTAEGFDAEAAHLTRSLGRLPKAVRQLVAAGQTTVSMKSRVPVLTSR